VSDLITELCIPTATTQNYFTQYRLWTQINIILSS